MILSSDLVKGKLSKHCNLKPGLHESLGNYRKQLVSWEWECRFLKWQHVSMSSGASFANLWQQRQLTMDLPQADQELAKTCVGAHSNCASDCQKFSRTRGISAVMLS
ncbi:F-box only protein 30 [Plakobranchus ocellatus]|uniref:F-box only protein 30 n=1 Tax=Plakobranchus ocellatus TaxID=259542 RepID=A0AAV3YWY3_9GAST|nr:F-box only protein 30 [Plakobranchus ocellatus]